MRNVSEMKKALVVRESSGRKVGTISRAVFHPSEPRLVGFIVKRPDVALMVKRDDCFLAYDSFTVLDGRLVAHKGDGSWDEAACERLGIDYEKCVVWEGMPVESSGGEPLGKIVDVSYDERDGSVVSVITSEGALSSLLIGKYEHAPSAVLGYSDGKIVLDEAALSDKATGGAAAAAGEAAAKAAAKARAKGPGAAKAVDDAVQAGAYKLGEQLGKTRGMFKGFKEEYEKARRGD